MTDYTLDITGIFLDCDADDDGVCERDFHMGENMREKSAQYGKDPWKWTTRK